MPVESLGPRSIPPMATQAAAALSLLTPIRVRMGNMVAINSRPRAIWLVIKIFSTAPIM